MKSYLACFIFASLVLIAVFGFAAMSHGAGHCIASAVQGAVCPNGDLLGFASFHLGFFKNFGNAVFKSLVAGAVLLAVALVALVLKSPESFGAGFKRTITWKNGGNRNFVALPIENIRQWLSLFENSPSLRPALG